jgi:hypothetical protein
MRKTIQEQLAEIYESMQLKENKPDYLDVDKDGDKKEPMKKALETAKCSDCGCNPKSPKKECTCKKHNGGSMKEGLRFINLCKSVLGEAKINKEEQYDCVMDDGKKKKLKGESLIALKKAGRVKSFKPAFVEKE